jgi:N-acetyl-gamma-glutamyl-phosphate reductase
MLKVGIVGGTGYTGAELVRLLIKHPQVKLEIVTSRAEDGVPLASMFPSLWGQTKLSFQAPHKVDLSSCDVVFFATPHGVALKEAPDLLNKGVRVIDLGADFRLKSPDSYQKWYGIEHTALDWLDKAIYGLAEVNREQIKSAQLVAMPGCYPTSVQLGFYPLLAEGLIFADSLIADCKSGVSGAGKKAEIALLHAEVQENFKAYGVAGHRHFPEIEQGLSRMTQDRVALTFTPHLVPMIRGIHSTLYAKIKPEFLEFDFQQFYENFYGKELFIDVLPKGMYPQTRSVRNTNRVQMAVERPNGRDVLTVLVVEDNLVKGASGQAVQVMNLMFGLSEMMGLDLIAPLP